MIRIGSVKNLVIGLGLALLSLALLGIISNAIQARKFRKETERYEAERVIFQKKIATLQEEIATKQQYIQLAKRRIDLLENKQDTLILYEKIIEKQIQDVLIRPTPTLDDNYKFFSRLKPPADSLRR